MYYEFECLMKGKLLGYVLKYIEGEVTEQHRKDALQEAQLQLATVGANEIGKVRKA